MRTETTLSDAPPRSANVDHLVSSIKTNADAYQAGVLGATGNLLASISALERAVEPAGQYVQRLRFQPLHHAGLVMALEMGVIDVLVTAKDGECVSAKQIAHTAKCEQSLIVRIMRLLTSLGIGRELGKEMYTPNANVRALDALGNRGGVEYFNRILLPVLINLPRYLHNTNKFTSSTSKSVHSPSPLDHTFGVPIWSILKQDRTLRTAFDNSMVGNNDNQHLKWFDKLPGVTRLAASSSPDGVIVDIGGGYGHDLVHFRNAYPDFQGRLVLQDLPETLETIHKPLPGIETMASDFFKPQQVQGANIYYMHNICHDWSDAECRVLLSHIAAAMKRGVSSLIIEDVVLKDLGETQKNAELDLLMMLLFGGEERTQSRWQKLLASVEPPLEIIHVWREKEEFQAVLEVRLRAGGDESGRAKDDRS